MGRWVDENEEGAVKIPMKHGGNSTMIGYRKDRRGRPSRPVRVVETGTVYFNVVSCARYLKVDPSSIYKCLRGERRSLGGFTFEFAD